MIGYWGYLQFETNDDWLQYPSDIERTVKGRYATFYPGDGSRAKRQFKGAETGTLTFTMYLDQRFNSNLRDLLAEMADWVNTGVAGELVIGNRSYGYNMWVCTKMVEISTHTLRGERDSTYCICEVTPPQQSGHFTKNHFKNRYFLHNMYYFFSEPPYKTNITARSLTKSNCPQDHMFPLHLYAPLSSSNYYPNNRIEGYLVLHQ